MRLTFGPRTRLTGPLLDRYDFYAYDKRCHVYAGAYVVGLASRSTNQRGLGMTLLSLSLFSSTLCLISQEDLVRHFLSRQREAETSQGRSAVASRISAGYRTAGPLVGMRYGSGELS